jgi:hypothetical protein
MLNVEHVAPIVKATTTLIQKNPSENKTKFGPCTKTKSRGFVLNHNPEFGAN